MPLLETATRRLGPLFVALCCSLAPSARQATLETAPADSRAAALARVERALETWHASHSVPGVSAALVLPDGGRLALARGVASLEDGTPLTPEGRMLSGSVGKTYVAASVLALAAGGELALDDRAARWLADWSDFARLPNAPELTLRQLLGHTSGLPRYVLEPAFWEALLADPEHRWTPEECLSLVLDAPPLFPAGEGWAYSDTNYLLLGMVLERVTGKPFYEHVRERFLAPLGLTDTVPSDTRRIERMVQGHVVASRAFGVGPRTLEGGVFTFNPQFEWCGGGWASTPLDLARWTRALYSGEALPAGALEEMLRRPSPAPELGPDTRYGLGVILWEDALGPARGHRGFMPGYLTATGYWPARELAVTVQCNTDDGASAGSLEALLERLGSAALGLGSTADGALEGAAAERPR